MLHQFAVFVVAVTEQALWFETPHLACTVSSSMATAASTSSAWKSTKSGSSDREAISFIIPSLNCFCLCCISINISLIATHLTDKFMLVCILVFSLMKAPFDANQLSKR
uniref:Uncharacterized protein n=1 Tax=Kalanchoe fedtschenkoi TaxID=63787 RepID=A0A7N0V8E4_KALFE